MDRACAERPMAEEEIAALFQGRFVVAGECWEFHGYREGGYGRIYLPNRRVLAHRYALELALGRGLVGNALHHCDNPPCFRPSHLYEGDLKQNAADRDARGRSAPLPTTKLTYEQVLDIRRRHIPGRNRWDRGNTQELADEYGLSKNYVSMLVKRGWASAGGAKAGVIGRAAGSAR